MSAEKTVLMIANDFPPVGGAGVQRSLYFVKYLPSFGWRPVVLTVKDVVFPSKDPSLLDQLPAEVVVERTESFELRRLLWVARRLFGRENWSGSRRAQEATPADESSADVHQRQVGARARDLMRGIRRWAFVPDDRVLWTPFAVARALRVIRREKIDVIYATVPCYSSGVIGQIVSRLAGLPLVLDLRDPWTHDPYFPAATPLHAWINARLESSTVHRSERAITISPQMTRWFRRAYPSLSPDHFLTLTNGFDAADLAAVKPRRTAKCRFSMVYSGSLYAHHQEAVKAFCRAWSLLAAEDAEFAAEAELLLVGRCDPEIETLFDERPEIEARILGYRPHHEALEHLLGSTCLLLLIKDLDPERHLITIPGKLFEYLGSGSPILMIGPEGDTAEIVRQAGGRVHRQSQIDDIGASLRRLFHARRATHREGRDPIPAADVAHYDRKHLTRRLAAEFDRATAPTPGQS